MDLNERQRLFIHYYLGECAGNATDAARRAGYRGNPNVLGVTGFGLLRHPKIRAAIDSRLDEVALTSAEILARLSDLARSSVEDLLTIAPDGAWKIDMLKAKQRRKLHNIKKIKTGRAGPEIELHNPISALEKLGQYRGLWKEKPSDENYANAEPAADDTDDVEPLPDQGPLPT